MTGNRSGQGPSGCGRRCCGMRRALALGALGAVSWAAFAGWDEASQTYSTNGYWSLAENGTSSSLTFDSPAKWRDAAGAVPSAFSPDAAYYINCQSYVSTATNTVQGEPVARFPGRVLALGPGSRFLGRGTTEARPFDMGEAVHLLSGATIDTWSGSLCLSGTWTLYPTDDKKCVTINMGSKTSSEQHGFFFRKVTLAGDARTKIEAFTNYARPEGTNLLNKLKWYGGCDARDFHGLFRLRGNSACPADSSARLDCEDMAWGGTLEFTTNTCLNLIGASGVTVSNVQFRAGSSVSNLTAACRLTVNGAITAEPVTRLFVQTASVRSEAGPVELELVRFAPTADLAGFTPANVELALTDPSYIGAWPLREVVLRADADGGHSLVVKIPQVVLRTPQEATPYLLQNAYNGGYRSDFQFPTTDGGGTAVTTQKPFWSDGLFPAGDAAAADKVYCNDCVTSVFPTNGETDVCIVFPGKALLLGGQRIEGSAPMGGFAVADLRFVKTGCGFRLLNQAGFADSTILHDGDTGVWNRKHRVTRLRGRLDTGAASFSHAIEIYGERHMLRLESDVTGAGNLRLQTYKSQHLTALNAFLELTGDNSGWRGKMEVRGLPDDTYYDYEAGGQTVSAPNRTWQNHCRLYLASANSLGGRRAAFAYDALSLHHYGELFLRASVTLPDGLNRGVSFGDFATLNVTNGLTFAVRQPTTWNGSTVYKVGGGTLALGGAAKFGGAAQADRPSAGAANRLVVEGGAVQPLAAEAFDGVSLEMAEGTAVRVSADAAGALAARGLVNVKAATPFVLGGGRLFFAVDAGAVVEDQLPRGVSVGLCTVAAPAAEGLRGRIDASRLLEHPAQIVERANADGTVTFTAEFKRGGMTLLIR